eukprot:436655-Hanusia_phi.AAC.2
MFPSLLLRSRTRFGIQTFHSQGCSGSGSFMPLIHTSFALRISAEREAPSRCNHISSGTQVHLRRVGINFPCHGTSQHPVASWVALPPQIRLGPMWKLTALSEISGTLASGAWSSHS